MLAADLLEPVPANRLIGLRVQAADPAGARVTLAVREQLTNVIGSLHASGLVALADAAGLAAIIGQADSAEAFAGTSVLGAAADLRFLAPARGTLTARCVLEDGARTALAALFAGSTDRTGLTTDAEISDADATVVCRGRFDWRLRRP